MADTQLAHPPTMIEPPYQIAQARLLLTGVAFNEDKVREVLPPGLEAVAGAPGIINAFVSGNSYPFGSYTGFYLSVDVEGYDSEDGSKARYMFAAAHGPQAGPAAMM